jgi:hypothetical protein
MSRQYSSTSPVIAERAKARLSETDPDELMHHRGGCEPPDRPENPGVDASAAVCDRYAISFQCPGERSREADWRIRHLHRYAATSFHLEVHQPVWTVDVLEDGCFVAGDLGVIRSGHQYGHAEAERCHLPRK